MHLIRAGAIENIESLLRLEGLNPNQTLASVGLTPALLRDPDTMISYKKLADFLDYCALICNEPLFGFRLAQTQSPLVIGELAAMLTNQLTIREALTFAQRYIHLHARGLRFELHQQGERSEFHFTFDFTNASRLEQLIQITAAQQFEYLTKVLPYIAKSVRIHVQSHIGEQQRSRLGRYAPYVVDESAFNGISFPERILDSKLEPDQSGLGTYFESRLNALTERYPNDLAAQVRYLCGNLLATGECNIDSVAAALGLEVRSLQRRLLNQGLNFRILLTQVRFIRAQQYLRDSQLSITEVALSLGYAEASIFSRNFKAWSGMTPLKWRGTTTMR